MSLAPTSPKGAFPPSRQKQRKPSNDGGARWILLGFLLTVLVLVGFEFLRKLSGHG